MTREERIGQAKRLMWDADVDLTALASLVAERSGYAPDECEAHLVLALRLETEKLLGGAR